MGDSPHRNTGYAYIKVEYLRVDETGGYALRNLYRLSQASTRLGLTEFPWNERTPFANLRRGHTLHSILPPLKEI